MNLVDEYFKRDLTEVEEQQLSAQLSSSPEVADRFARLMGEFYVATGLPEPQWPGKPLPPQARPSRWWERPLVPSVLILLVLAFLLFRLLHPPALPVPEAPPSPSLPAKAPVVKHHAPAKPIPPAPGKVYEQLSVVVNLPQTGLVTVRAVNGQGEAVRTLYVGLLPAGQKTFTWDGKTDKGSVAPKGDYFIQVQSGQTILKEPVQVQGAAP